MTRRTAYFVEGCILFAAGFGGAVLGLLAIALVVGAFR